MPAPAPLPAPAQDAVNQRPASPTENGLDSANSGNSMGDGPRDFTGGDPAPRGHDAADAVGNILGTTAHFRAVLGFGLVPFLLWAALFASWGSVSFVSVQCQEPRSTVPFPMTSPDASLGRHSSS